MIRFAQNVFYLVIFIVDMSTNTCFVATNLLSHAISNCDQSKLTEETGTGSSFFLK